MRSASPARARAGLLEFAHAGNGAMVKRLHMGRAAEGGVLAANLAAQGFTGPTSVLEGEPASCGCTATTGTWRS